MFINDSGVDFSLDVGLDSEPYEEYYDLKNLNITDDLIKSLCGDQEIAVNVPVMVFRILVCAFGIFGNLMVIFVILVLREFEKAVTHWYVLQLAIADTLFLLTLPFKMMEETHGQWIFGGELCRGKETILFLNYYSSILFLMVMSIDRYIAVCHSFSQGLQKFRRKKAAYIITFLVWSISLLLSIPTMLYSDKRGVEPHCTCTYEFPMDKKTPEEICRYETFGTSNKTLQECIERQNNRTDDEQSCRKIECTGIANSFKSIQASGDSIFTNLMGNESETGTYPATTEQEPTYNPGCSYVNTGRGFVPFLTFNFLVMFVLPFFIMAGCYCLIALKLKRVQTRKDSSTTESTTSAGGERNVRSERKRHRSAATEKADKNRMRVTYICLALVLLFVVCWLPFHAVHLAKIYGMQGTTEFCTTIAMASSLIAYINSALNPYIYNFIGTRFGKRLRAAAGSVRASVKKRTGSTMSSGIGTVRYVNRKQNSGGTSSNSATAMTKIYKSKIDNETTQAPSTESDENKQAAQNPLAKEDSNLIKIDNETTQAPSTESDEHKLAAQNPLAKEDSNLIKIDNETTQAPSTESDEHKLAAQNPLAKEDSNLIKIDNEPTQAPSTESDENKLAAQNLLAKEDSNLM